MILSFLGSYFALSLFVSRHAALHIWEEREGRIFQFSLTWPFWSQLVSGHNLLLFKKDIVHISFMLALLWANGWCGRTGFIFKLCTSPPTLPCLHMPSSEEPCSQSCECIWEAGAEPLSPVNQKWYTCNCGKLSVLLFWPCHTLLCIYIILCPSYVKDPVLEFFGVNKRLVLFIKVRFKFPV